MINKINFYNILLKYNLITIVKSEDTFLKVVQLEKIPKKLDRNIVEINYGHFSPYKNSYFIYHLDKNILYIWFFTKKIDTPFVFAESYVLLRYFIKEKKVQNEIIFFDTIYKMIFVIRDGRLKKQIIKKSFNDFELKLIQKEFEIKKIIKFSESEYNTFLKKGIKSLNLIDYYNFFYIKMDFKTLINIIFKKIYISVLITVILLIIIEGINYFYLNKKITKIEQNYKYLRKKTQIIRKQKQNLLKLNKLYLITNENIKYNKVYFNILEKISKVLKKYQANIIFIKLNDNDFAIRFDTNNTNKIFSEFIKINSFSKLKIQNSVKNKYNRLEQVFIKGKINVK